ncbi:hypothetical protein SUGI_0174060 [Cryptomeria japonica]|nr:hypothetical protein SUGI_0174060 [Cryptomeria japonica]
MYDDSCGGLRSPFKSDHTVDRFSGNNGVIVLAATNQPNVLDSAILHPANFDRQISKKIDNVPAHAVAASKKAISAKGIGDSIDSFAAGEILSQHVKPRKVENKDARQELNGDSTKPWGYGGLDILSNDIVQAVMDGGDMLQWCKLQVLEMEKMIPCFEFNVAIQDLLQGKDVISRIGIVNSQALKVTVGLEDEIWVLSQIGKMEVEAIRQVRHKKLVRLNGYCVEGTHRKIRFFKYDEGGVIDKEDSSNEDVVKAIHMDDRIPKTCDKIVKRVSSRAFDIQRQLKQRMESSSYDNLEANPRREDSKHVYVLAQGENHLWTMKTQRARSEVETCRARADAASITAEQSCALLEQKYHLLSGQFTQLENKKEAKMLSGPVVNAYPLSKEPEMEKDTSVADRLARMKINYMKEGMRTSVEAILLV